MLDNRTAQIAALNDKLRTTFFNGGRTMITRSVASLDEDTRQKVLRAVQTFDNFNEDNNPYGERDFVSVEVDGERYFAKIDYYGMTFDEGSEDPANPEVTTRIMTIMHSSDY
ncbi:DUF3768 domain-containing protein [Xinfangfangia sp. CPCC 101601]|uniref:DUF3768 domain-containing protein n=1 Tax=Pseudogemmobacter lacusdianii TaxID=3069608 RepID=A0ABU0VYC6_9RHOB|nr:DUF3768 domain-containing protein [Xinfangfangia sp. CPCC 101601]MDQ2066755.1 DUF3768 domain-containing protein [Xinfangfangia sp. CPCC 101601]